jgi:hypothetical protein
VRRSRRERHHHTTRGQSRNEQAMHSGKVAGAHTSDKRAR